MSENHKDNENGYSHLDPIRQYLRDIGQTPLITTEEEIKLAGLIKAGDLEAREKMIKANLRLVVKIAKQYQGFGLQLLDLINEGNIGLMKAVERFSPDKGAKFSTYGSWWIKQTIRRAVTNQSRDIRLPVHVFDKISHMNRAANKLVYELNRQPSDEELAEELDISAESVRNMKKAFMQTVQLNLPIGEDGHTTLSDIIPDNKATDPSEDSCEQSDFGHMRKFISELNTRDRKVISLRFGLNNGGEGLTLDQVSKKFGVTRERIRQIQDMALHKLRRRMKGENYRDPTRRKKRKYKF